MEPTPKTAYLEEKPTVEVLRTLEWSITELTELIKVMCGYYHCPLFERHLAITPKFKNAQYEKQIKGDPLKQIKGDPHFWGAYGSCIVLLCHEDNYYAMEHGVTENATIILTPKEICENYCKFMDKEALRFSALEIREHDADYISELMKELDERNVLFFREDGITGINLKEGETIPEDIYPVAFVPGIAQYRFWSAYFHTVSSSIIAALSERYRIPREAVIYLPDLRNGDYFVDGERLKLPQSATTLSDSEFREAMSPLDDYLGRIRHKITILGDLIQGGDIITFDALKKPGFFSFKEEGHYSPVPNEDESEKPRVVFTHNVKDGSMHLTVDGKPKSLSGDGGFNAGKTLLLAIWKSPGHKILKKKLNGQYGENYRRKGKKHLKDKIGADIFNQVYQDGGNNGTFIELTNLITVNELR